MDEVLVLACSGRRVFVDVSDRDSSDGDKSSAKSWLRSLFVGVDRDVRDHGLDVVVRCGHGSNDCTSRSKPSWTCCHSKRRIRAGFCIVKVLSLHYSMHTENLAHSSSIEGNVGYAYK